MFCFNVHVIDKEMISCYSLQLGLVPNTGSLKICHLELVGNDILAIGRKKELTSDLFCRTCPLK